VTTRQNEGTLQVGIGEIHSDGGRSKRNRSMGQGRRCAPVRSTLPSLSRSAAKSGFMIEVQNAGTPAMWQGSSIQII